MSILLFLMKVLLVVILFLITEYAAYVITEKVNLPEWINHKPFNCRVCCQFWANLLFCLAVFCGTRWTAPCLIWLVLTLLETAALKIDENNKYVSDDFYEDGDLEEN